MNEAELKLNIIFFLKVEFKAIGLDRIRFYTCTSQCGHSVINIRPVQHVNKLQQLWKEMDRDKQQHVSW